MARFKHKDLAAGLVMAAIALTFFLWLKYFPEQYYIAVALLLAEAVALWLIYLEKSKPKARELAIMAALSALAVAGRVLFFLLPQIKPTAAIVFLSGLALGKAPGFTIGLLSMFLSNFIFGQSINTPFQMFGMALVGWSGGFFFPEKMLKSRPLQMLTAFLAVFFLYGIVVDTGSVLFLYRWQKKAAVLTTYLMGIPFNLAHALSSAVFLFFLSPLLLPQMQRICRNYGLFDYGMIE